ncbi:hypothetical protein [Sandaracinus amylolyticus]|uniref:hypothetical protein n=1 Tax=Sandaracinus amylolyticus TaxID=927083 RepID=UPI001F3DB0B3|nr:hypothetical protein [Sandaracinus amylolyticus]UJR80160.1 Hypothetical protein I5071_22040 [Sandaracinus amylolyticus]
MRRWVVIGRTATASPEFSLIDLPGSSGRLDVLVRCVRAALLVSNGVRRDTIVDLVLLGGRRAPRVVRFDGRVARYVRPGERYVATVIQKALAHEPEGPGFTALRNGISIANGGLDVVLSDLGDVPRVVLEQHGTDVRAARLDSGDLAIFVGDHLGLDDAARAAIEPCTPISIGPVSVHADDAIAVMSNELDRRAV